MPKSRYLILQKAKKTIFESSAFRCGSGGKTLTPVGQTTQSLKLCLSNIVSNQCSFVGRLAHHFILGQERFGFGHLSK
jgi:hypothetical protein